MPLQGSLIFKQKSILQYYKDGSAARSRNGVFEAHRDSLPASQGQQDVFLFQAFVSIETATLRIIVTLCFGSIPVGTMLEAVIRQHSASSGQWLSRPKAVV